jgi:hypothetical protein
MHFLKAGLKNPVSFLSYIVWGWTSFDSATCLECLVSTQCTNQLVRLLAQSSYVSFFACHTIELSS